MSVQASFKRKLVAIYAVMAMTTLGTFCTLVASYQLLFPGPFASA